MQRITLQAILDRYRRKSSVWAKIRADKSKTTRSIKIAGGQLDSILRMIEEDRYRVEISNQLLGKLII